MRTVEDVLGTVDGLIANDKLVDPWIKAQVLLKRAELALLVEERDDRRRGAAGATAAKLELNLNDGGDMVPLVSPGVDGKTLYLSFGNKRRVVRTDLRRSLADESSEEFGGRLLRVWHLTVGLRHAGWSIQFVFGLRQPDGLCKHSYTTELDLPRFARDDENVDLVKSRRGPVESPCCVICGHVPEERMFFFDEVISR